MLKDMTAIVTGSTSGIGLSIAHRLASEGANIMLNGFGDPSLIAGLREDIASKYGVSTDYSSADMSRPAEIRELIEQTHKEFDRVDILVNNAGIQFTSPIEDFPDEKWDMITAINYSAVFHTIKHAFPIMKQQDFGRIINIASAHGLVASAEKAAYVAAKHGVVGLTKVVAIEAGEHDITCNAVCPGWVDTPLVRKQIEARAKESGRSIDEETRALIGEKQPNRRFTSPEQIAGTVAFLCQHESRAITGTAISVDGGWTAW